MYARLARWSFRHRLLVLIAWIAAIVGINGIGAAIGGATFNAEMEIPASETADGFATLEEHFPSQGGALTGSIVFQHEGGVDQPEVQEAMEGLFAAVDEIEGVATNSPYSEFARQQQISPDGTIAFAQVNFDNDIDQTESSAIGKEILELVPEQDGLRVELGGAALAAFEPPETELVGLAFAIVILIVAFGSVLAMGLPIGVALFGVGTGSAIVVLITHLMTVPDFAPLIGVMIGLGAGIDYALFIITRYREGTKEGLSPEEATVTAMDTAGRAVVFAGLTVVVSLLGMLLIGLAFISGLGIAAAVTVACTMLASVTLLPALLGFAGSKVEVTRWRGLVAAASIAAALLFLGIGASTTLVLAAVALALLTLTVGSFIPPLMREVPERTEKPLRETMAYRWSRIVQRNPWQSLLVGGGLLLLLSAPMLSLRLGFSDEGNFSEETTTRQAYDLVAEGFGPGFNGPFVVAIEVDSPQDMAVVAGLQKAILADEGVASASPPIPSDRENPESSSAFLISVVPTTSPQDALTNETVERLREIVVPAAIEGSTVTANITGAVPANIDFSAFLAKRILVFLAVVLGLSFILLMAVFRSVVVPLKAVIMNMLSISAAYGLVVALFQWGWFGGLTGIEPAPIEPFIPMMLFAIVFGLSMDYEVFLLSRVKEEFDRTGDPVESVADGLASTARVITAAAAIMVVVFGSFLFEDDRIIKLFGTGLASAVFLDATLVRMLLVPATMELLGGKNWWLPGWLDKIVPTINVEGPAPVASVE